MVHVLVLYHSFSNSVMELQQRKLAILGVATALHPMDRGERDRGALRHLDGRLPAPTRNGEHV